LYASKILFIVKAYNVPLFQGKRKVKYLIKHEVKLNIREEREDEPGKPQEEKSWGVEEEDDVRFYFCYTDDVL